MPADVKPPNPASQEVAAVIGLHPHVVFFRVVVDGDCALEQELKYRVASLGRPCDGR